MVKKDPVSPGYGDYWRCEICGEGCGDQNTAFLCEINDRLKAMMKEK